MIGSTVGNYVVQRKIGEGGMGIVYVAEHPRIGRRVAIKVLLPQLSANANVVSRFFNEARASSEIRNEHIVDVLDFGNLPDGSSYFVMEWLDGVSLAEALQGGALGTERALHIANGVGRALAAAHRKGIVHRDLKPDNIMLIEREGDPDFVKVLDFGIAKLMQAEAGVDVKTKTGALLGTPSYMSPEQCRGLPIDHRSDIYSTGVILYQMLTGKLPFEADGLGNLLLAHMTEPPAPPRTINPAVPAEVEAVVLRALEKDAGQRYQRIEELLIALGDRSGRQETLPELGAPTAAMVAQDTLAVAAGEEVPATRGGGPSPARRLAVMGVAAAAVLGVAALVLWRANRPSLPEAANGPAHAAAPTMATATAAPEAGPARAAAPTTATPTMAAKTTAPATTEAGPAKTTPPTTTEAAAATQAALSVRVTPADAVVTLDGAAIANPFSGRFPRDGARHRLVARAPGYAPRAEWVAFDGDRAVELALVREARPRARAEQGDASAEHNGAIKESKDQKPVYKGTKGKLITSFPE